MSPDANGGFNWDDEISNDGTEFTLLPPGEYPFVVRQYERARHEGSEKLPSCNKAIVHIEIDGGDYGRTTIKHNLFLHQRTEGLLCAFFKAVGARKSGEKLKMDWNKTVGKSGRCKVKTRKGNGEYKDREYNEIDRFLEPFPNGAMAAVAADEDDDDAPF